MREIFEIIYSGLAYHYQQNNCDLHKMCNLRAFYHWYNSFALLTLKNT